MDVILFRALLIALIIVGPILVICQALKNIVGYNLATDLNRMDERGGNTFAFSNLPDKRLLS